MNELTLDKTYRRGSRGRRVRWIQEWLSLNGFGVAVDGDFGPATQLAVTEFQKHEGLAETGRVTAQTYQSLIAPMQFVLQGIPARQTLRQTVAAYARRHHSQSPREAGGQNMGPWVRLYMKGKEGRRWRWCAGFVCFVLEQACNTVGTDLPIEPSFSCDSLAASAKERDRFLPGRRLDRSKIKPGMFFLHRRMSTDWTHVGIVIRGGSEVFMSIEGNTNGEGGHDGYKVCQRIRSYRSKDFILI